MSVVMPDFLKEENRKWSIENRTPNGDVIYVAKADAPEKIKKEVKEWNKMIKQAEKEYRIL